MTTFCFNEAFQLHQKKELVESFFKDSVVISILNKLLPNWNFAKEMIVNIEMNIIPCSISSMSFFDRILDENNKIVRTEGCIRQCLDDVIDGFTVSDELRKVSRKKIDIKIILKLINLIFANHV